MAEGRGIRMSEKWVHFSKRELCDIHHACDMLLKRGLPVEERLPLQTLAAEAWAEHCRRLSTPKKIGTTVQGQELADFFVRNLPNITVIAILALAVWIVWMLA